MIDLRTYRLSIGAALALCTGSVVVLMVLSSVTAVTDWNTLDPEDDVRRILLADGAPRTGSGDDSPVTAGGAVARPIVLAVPGAAAADAAAAGESSASRSSGSRVAARARAARPASPAAVPRSRRRSSRRPLRPSPPPLPLPSRPRRPHPPPLRPPPGR